MNPLSNLVLFLIASKRTVIDSLLMDPKGLHLYQKMKLDVEHLASPNVPSREKSAYKIIVMFTITQIVDFLM